MNRGEIVLVDWPFSDAGGTKLRPAVVVQADYLNGVIDDTVYVKVQGRAYGLPGTEVRLDPAAETGSGLAKVSWASCKDILTRDQALVHHTLGYRLDPAAETGSGLAKVSWASCKDILTRDQALVHHTLGYLSNAAMREIADCLKQVLELP